MEKIVMTICNEDKTVNPVRPMFVEFPPDGWVMNAKIAHGDIFLTTNLWEKHPQCLKCLCVACIQKANIGRYRAGDPIATPSRSIVDLQVDYVGLYLRGSEECQRFSGVNDCGK